MAFKKPAGSNVANKTISTGKAALTSAQAGAKNITSKLTPATQTVSRWRKDWAGKAQGFFGRLNINKKGGPSESERQTLTRLITIVAIVLAIVLTVFGVLIYRYKSNSQAVSTVAKFVPYPVQRVNNGFVSYAQYLFEVNSIKHYYQNQTGADNKPTIDFNTAEGKAKLKDLQKQVIDQLKADEVAKQLISKHKITVSSKELTEQLDQITKAAGGPEKVKEVLTKFYGWTQDDLKTKVKFQLAKSKLQTKITSDDGVNAQAKKKAEDVLALVKAGGDFAELAKTHSQDSSASGGGDLGFFGKGQMVPEFETAAYALQPGQTSDIVKSKFGYHIIRVVEKKDDTVRASHILIKSIDFDQYLGEQVKNAKVKQYFTP